MEIIVDGENSKEEEEEKSNPGTPCGPFQSYEKGPQSHESQEEEDQSLRSEGEIKMAQVDSNRVGEKDWNERQAKDSIHLRHRQATL